MKTTRTKNWKTAMTVSMRAQTVALVFTTLVSTSVLAQGPRRGGGDNGRTEPLPLEAERHAKFTATDNLIGTYVYSGDYGLNAVGATKTGSMLSPEHFYDYQSEAFGANSLGQAFRRASRRLNILGSQLRGPPTGIDSCATAE